MLLVLVTRREISDIGVDQPATLLSLSLICASLVE